MSTYIAAIDLGTTKVVTLIGEKTDNGRYRILAYDEAESSGINRGQVDNILLVIEAIKPTIENVKQKAGIAKLDEVYVGIAGQHIRCITNRADLTRTNFEEEITAEEVQALENSMFNIRMEPGEKVLNVIPQHYNVDDALEVTDPIGRLGQRISGSFHIIIGKTNSAKHTALCIERVGLQLKELILEPLASARAVLTEDEKEAGVVMIDMGGGTTDIVVYFDGIMRHTAVIPFGGNIISEDIRKGCGILLKEAEKLKVGYGSCLASQVDANKIVAISRSFGRDPREISFKVLAQIIEARFEEIMKMVMIEIERSGFADKLSAGIVFTGGGSQIMHLPQFVKLKTGYDVRIGKPEYIAANSENDILQARFSTAVGLVMCGFDRLENNQNNHSNVHGLLVNNQNQSNADGLLTSKPASIVVDNNQPLVEVKTEAVKEIQEEKPAKPVKAKAKPGAKMLDAFLTFFSENQEDTV